ncbi:MAG: hypothetical protein ACW99F_09285 [Candidatus Hodarchaeales archaeon]
MFAVKADFTSMGESWVFDIKSKIQVIMEGGSYRSVKRFTKKYCFHRIYNY